MFGQLGDIAKLMKQARGMQEQMKTMQEELASARFEAEVGAGAVKAVVNGKGSLVDIKIRPDATEDVELLEDLIKSAIGAATKKAADGAAEKMQQLTGGMNLPGLSEMLGGS